MNKHKILIGFFILFLAIEFCACKNNKESAIATIVTEWIDKKIQFLENYQCNFWGSDTTATLCNELFATEYKVLLYVDSTGYTDCRLKLFQWKQLIEESDSLLNDKLSFLFFFQPKDKDELNFFLKRDKFNYPIFIDNGTLNSLNHFPTNTEYQCFLLDKNNKVLLIGNPVLNSKIWELYKQTIFGKIEPGTQQPLTTVSVQQQEITLTGLQKDKTSTTVFKLKNTGDNPLLITHIDSSCGCTVPTYDKQPVEQGKDAEIKVEITPEETGAFYKTIRVFCNTEKGVVSLAVKGMIEQ